MKNWSKPIAIAAVLLSGMLPLVTIRGEDKPADDKKLSYKLQPFDLIKVQVFQEPDLEREVRISKDNTVILPLIGTIELKDKTVHEAELMMADLYNKDYLVNPQINITVMEYAPRTVNVLGAVNTPGSVLIPPEQELSLLDVIARSGGFSRLANRTKVSLTRKQTDGQTQNFTINADHLMSGDGAQSYIVQSGDVVFVPERML